MAIVVEAVYENGVLRPKAPLPLQEHEQVRITIQPTPGAARRSAGMIPFAGDADALERLVRDPEFGIMESP